MRFRLPLLLLAACAAAARAEGVVWTFGADERGRFGVVSAASAGVAAIEVPSERGGEPVRAIGAEAFAACDGLAEVRLPATVEWVDPCAFAGCPTLERILVEDGCAEYSSRDGLLFDGAGTWLLNCPEGRTGDVVVPAGTEEIDAGAFADCASLRSVAIPAGVARAGAGVFSGCAGLEALYLPAGSPCDPAAMGAPASCEVVRYAPGGLDDPTLPPRWAVRFSANGGTGTMGRQVFRTGVAGPLRANAFKRKGRVFAGWSRSRNGGIALGNGASVRDLAPAGGTVRLYAVWAVRKYRVAFRANGGTGRMRAQSFVYGKAKRLRANAFRRKGHSFAGWARRPSGKAAFANRKRVSNLTRKGGTVRLYAKWRAHRYTVRFDPNGGTGRMSGQRFVYDGWKRLRANAFRREGYRFLGWSRNAGATRPSWKDRDKVRNLTAKRNATLVLYAVWIRSNDPRRILCLGDSITEGYACAGLPYPARLARLTGREVVNCGVGGATAKAGLRTAESNILSAGAGTVCILFGSNDAIHEVDPDRTKDSLREIVRLCREYGCAPVLGTPPHQSGSHARFDEGVSAVAEAIRALAREEDVPLADANAAFGGRDEYLNPDDGLHLSDAGGDLLARLFRDAL